MLNVYTCLQTSEDGRCQSARRKGHRRQRTRPATATAIAATAAADKEMLSAGDAELQLLQSGSDLCFSDLDATLGSPYRRRMAPTAGRTLFTQVLVTALT